LYRSFLLFLKLVGFALPTLCTLTSYTFLHFPTPADAPETRSGSDFPTLSYSSYTPPTFPMLPTLCIVLIFVYIYRKRISGQDTSFPHLPRTKAAPSSLHACITLAPSSHKVRFGFAYVSHFIWGKYEALFYHNSTDSGVFVPALKRRKSEGRAKEKRRKCN